MPIHPDTRPLFDLVLDHIHPTFQDDDAIRRMREEREQQTERARRRRVNAEAERAAQLVNPR